MKAHVLGCGSIGTRHARNLLSLGVEVVVSDVVEDAAASLAESTGATAVTRETAPACDLVVVATPTAQHVADLEWALQRDADVFVEKPLAATLDGVATARALAEQYSDRVVMVGCNLRFSEGFTTMADNLPTVGRLAVVLADYGWWLPSWRPATDYRREYSASRALGGGIVLDAIHEIDYVLAIAGPATGIDATCSTTGVLELDVEDVADITLRHHDGVHTHIHLDYLRRTYTRSCTIIGALGELRWDVPRGTVALVPDVGSEVQLLAAAVDADSNAQYVAEMEHFLGCVQSRTPTCNDIARAATTVEVALMARDGQPR